MWTYVDVPCSGRTSASVRLATNVGILILVSKFEAEVVHDVSGIFDNVGSLLQITLRSIAADDLKLGHVVWVGGGRQA